MKKYSKMLVLIVPVPGHCLSLTFKSHYVNVIVLKVFTKDQCFYLNYHKFFIKNRLGEAILIHIHNI